MSGSPSYTPYNPKGNRKLPTSPLQSSPTPPNKISSSSPSPRSLGLIRPSITSNHTDSIAIKSPQPLRPSIPSTWATTNQLPRSSSSSSLTSTSTPPFKPSSRATPPPPNSNSFPYNSVSPGQSPFPPSSPKRNGSPAVNQQQQQQQQPISGSNSIRRGGGTPKTGDGERSRVNYHPSFQPQGVRRDRTDYFMSKRRAKGEGKKLEEGRLGRRMEKLVALHFPEDSISTSSTPTRSSPLITISDIGGSLRGKSALDLWRSVTNSTKEIEKAEQAIVKWQEDSEISRCPICMAAFGIKTRRHHCRLCGRVVCFLPPTLPTATSTLVKTIDTSIPAPIPMPTRKERCSTFITHEYERMIIGGEKRLVGVTSEIEQVERDLSFDSLANTVPGGVKEKDERKKVRVCRECLSVVMRQQAQMLPIRTPTWLKLYEVLVQLEKNIEDALPEFQELILGIQKPSTALSSSQHPPSALAAQSLRKRLMSDLASYDSLSKQIQSLPLTASGVEGGSQDRLQKAIAHRGTIFLTDKLGVLRTLGNIDGKSEKVIEAKNEKKVKEYSTVTTLKDLVGGNDAEKEMEGKLSVLLEQEALVLGFVEDANHRRQFEDAQSLKASLDELRAEISRIRSGGK